MHKYIAIVFYLNISLSSKLNLIISKILVYFTFLLNKSFKFR